MTLKRHYDIVHIVSMLLSYFFLCAKRQNIAKVYILWYSDKSVCCALYCFERYSGVVEGKRRGTPFTPNDIRTRGIGDTVAFPQAGLEINAKSMVSWFSEKSLKLLPADKGEDGRIGERREREGGRGRNEGKRRGRGLWTFHSSKFATTPLERWLAFCFIRSFIKMGEGEGERVWARGDKTLSGYEAELQRPN